MSGNSKEKHKVKLERSIFYKSSENPLKWSDIKHLDLQDDDVIISQYEYAEDSHFYIEVIRHELETDEEFSSRMKRIERDEEFQKRRRPETYLKLKEEFEKTETNE